MEFKVLLVILVLQAVVLEAARRPKRRRPRPHRKDYVIKDFIGGEGSGTPEPEAEVKQPDTCPEDWSFSAVANQEGGGEFVQMLYNYDVTATIFVPTDDAFRRFFLENAGIGRDAMREILRYHATPDMTYMSGLPEFSLRLSSMLPGRSMIVSKRPKTRGSDEMIMTVQCEQIVAADLQFYFGVMHMVDKVLTPPSGDVMHVMRQKPELSRVVAALDQFNLSERLSYTSGSRVTVFAPNNRAFERLERMTPVWNYFLDNPEVLSRYISSHIILDYFCCHNNQTMRLYSLGGRFDLDSTSDVTLANGVPVVEKNMAANNGVLHVVSDFREDILWQLVPIPAAFRENILLLKHSSLD